MKLWQDLVDALAFTFRRKPDPAPDPMTPEEEIKRLHSVADEIRRLREIAHQPQARPLGEDNAHWLQRLDEMREQSQAHRRGLAKIRDEVQSKRRLDEDEIRALRRMRDRAMAKGRDRYGKPQGGYVGLRRDSPNGVTPVDPSAFTDPLSPFNPASPLSMYGGRIEVYSEPCGKADSGGTTDTGSPSSDSGSSSCGSSDSGSSGGGGAD